MKIPGKFISPQHISSSHTVIALQDCCTPMSEQVSDFKHTCAAGSRCVQQRWRNIRGMTLNPRTEENERYIMSTKTIFYSYSGITKSIAEKIQSECGGELVEVKTVKPYSTITAYSMGCYRAMRGESDAIVPASIDVSASDCIVIGTPVWAFRAAPAVNGAVKALTGCEGKTCRTQKRLVP